MATLRLSERAEADLTRIYLHGLHHYGEAQPDLY